jgi:hypothetical protein
MLYRRLFGKKNSQSQPSSLAFHRSLSIFSFFIGRTEHYSIIYLIIDDKKCRFIRVIKYKCQPWSAG